MFEVYGEIGDINILIRDLIILLETPCFFFGGGNPNLRPLSLCDKLKYPNPKIFLPDGVQPDILKTFLI